MYKSKFLELQNKLLNIFIFTNLKNKLKSEENEIRK